MTYEAVVECHICNVALFLQGAKVVCTGGIVYKCCTRGRQKVFGDFAEGDRCLFISWWYLWVEGEDGGTGTRCNPVCA